jgi:non-heme chloroperoxidase
LVNALKLKDAIFVGHSTGGGETCRYVAKYGAKTAAKAVMISAIPPVMLKSAKNPQGTPMEAFDGIRDGLQKDRSQFWKDLSAPFYGANRPGSKVSQGLRDSFWLQGQMAGLKAVYDCVKVFSETDFTEDLKKIECPTLVLHGDDDQIVPIDDAARLSIKLLKNGQLKVIKGAPHGMCSTLKDEVNQILLDFIKLGKVEIAEAA